MRHCTPQQTAQRFTSLADGLTNLSSAVAREALRDSVRQRLQSLVTHATPRHIQSNPTTAKVYRWLGPTDQARRHSWQTSGISSPHASVVFFGMGRAYEAKGQQNGSPTNREHLGRRSTGRFVTTSKIRKPMASGAATSSASARSRSACKSGALRKMSFITSGCGSVRRALISWIWNCIPLTAAHSAQILDDLARSVEVRRSVGD